MAAPRKAKAAAPAPVSVSAASNEGAKTNKVERRPAFEPTDKDRSLVEALVGLGSTETHIAGKLGIDPKTLRKHFRAELDSGVDAVNAKVAGALFKKATGDGPGSVTAAIFWLKTRAGWKETLRVEKSPIEDLSDGELAAFVDAFREEGGLGEGDG